jgi:hypothetical protein
LRVQESASVVETTVAGKLEWAVSRIRLVNQTLLTRRYQPDGNGLCGDVAFISHVVHMVTTSIYKRHPRGVDVGRAGGIIPLILRYRS